MSTQGKSGQESAIISILSQERMLPYFEVCGGSWGKALRLYEWNIHISSALYEALSVAEIALRNALDTQLTQLFSTPHVPWYDNMSTLINSKALQDISQAKSRAFRSPKVPTPGRVVAELNLGFWRYLLASRYETTLWTPALKNAFPNLENLSRKKVYETVSLVHTLRNRIAHHEAIYQRNLFEDLEVISNLVEWISTETSEWMHRFEVINDVLGQRPL